MIIERAGQPIAEIFSNEGETGFRQREQTVVKKLAAQKPQHTVIATGGGAPCFFDNMKVMNASGITIFLDGTPELLADRTMVDEKAGKPVRPLIAGMDRESRIAKFEEFSTKRRPFYEQAHITISLL